MRVRPSRIAPQMGNRIGAVSYTHLDVYKRQKLTRKSYTEKQVESNKKWIRRIAGVLKYVTFAALSVGLIWCVFFLTLGIVSPQQSDYANNMAELIVAVLTVISIIFAFVEFLHRN